MIMKKEDYIIGIYIRTAEKDDEAVRLQETLNTSYCEYRDLNNIYKIYKDNGKSGMSENRPAYKRLLKDVRDGKVNVIVVSDFERLTRQPILFYKKILPYLLEHRLLVLSVMDSKVNEIKISQAKTIINFAEMMKIHFGGVE